MLDNFKICHTPYRFYVFKLVSQVEFLSRSHRNIDDFFLELGHVETNEFSKIKLPIFHGVLRGKFKDIFYIGPMLNFQILVAKGLHNWHSFSKIEN